jgi:hypothetical protein
MRFDPGVEQVFGVEDGFDLLEEAVEVGAEEAFVGPTANSAVAMLAGKGAAVAVQEVNGEVDDAGEFGDFFGFFGVD